MAYLLWTESRMYRSQANTYAQTLAQSTGLDHAHLDCTNATEQKDHTTGLGAEQCLLAAEALFGCYITLRDKVPSSMNLGPGSTPLINLCTKRLDMKVGQRQKLRRNAPAPSTKKLSWSELAGVEWVHWLGRYYTAASEFGNALACYRVAIRAGASVDNMEEREEDNAHIYHQGVPKSVDLLLTVLVVNINRLRCVPPVDWENVTSLATVSEKLLPLQ